MTALSKRKLEGSETRARGVRDDTLARGLVHVRHTLSHNRPARLASHAHAAAPPGVTNRSCSVVDEAKVARRLREDEHDREGDRDRVAARDTQRGERGAASAWLCKREPAEKNDEIGSVHAAGGRRTW